MIQVTVEHTNVADFACDVLALKYAQSFYGVDAIVANALTRARHGQVEIGPGPGDHVLIPSEGAVAAKKVLFLGVVPLADFDYSEIRTFAMRALTILSEKSLGTRHVAMTIHGVNYGLDEREAFLAQLGGIMDAEKKGVLVERVSIVEREAGRATRLRMIVEETWPLPPRIGYKIIGGKKVKVVSRWPLNQTSEFGRQQITAGAGSRSKPHVFVAMPFSKDLEDVYVFGIQGPVNTAGYLCERGDMATFTGDILDRIKSRIETATLIIADLPGANANVYLEVGYAWGKNRPTLLLAKKGDELKFDVRGQRCIVYENIVELSKKLQADLGALPGNILPEPVLLGVAAPRQVVPGSSFNARFVAYIAGAKKSAERHLRQLGEKNDRIVTDIPPDRDACWRIGAPIMVRLTGEHVRITPVESNFEWNGRENLVNFAVQVDPDAPRVTLQICFHVFLGPVQIAFIPVAVSVSAARLTDREPLQVDVRPPSSAFASYCSKDAEAVSRCLSTLAHWAPTLDIFQDCLDLTPKEGFKARLAAEIAARDVFLLFWSRNARASKWVLWEFKTAKVKPGLNAILPMPLEDPRLAPPPPGFKDKHLRDRFMIAGYGLKKIAEESDSTGEVKT